MKKATKDETYSQFYASRISGGERCCYDGDDGQETVKVLVADITADQRDCCKRIGDDSPFEMNVQVHSGSDDDFGNCRACITQQEMMDTEQSV